MRFPSRCGWNPSRARHVKLSLKPSPRFWNTPKAANLKKLQTDDGKEFYNKTLATLMKLEGIHYFSTYGDTNASIVERFNRTFKERLYRCFTVRNTSQYLNVLPQLVAGVQCFLSLYHWYGSAEGERRERERSVGSHVRRTSVATKKPLLKPNDHVRT